MTSPGTESPLPRPPARPVAPARPEGPPPPPSEYHSLGDILDAVLASRWLVLAVAATVLAGGTAWALLATPIFRTDVLLQVEERKAGMSGLDELSTMFGQATPAEAEIEILRSRSLVGQVVDELRLDVQARPRRFPLVGAALARLHDGHEPAPAPPLLARFAWGGERITVPRLSVPPALLDRPLRLGVGTDGTFTLDAPGGRRLGEGRVGLAFSAGGVETFVAELAARPGTEFLLTVRRRERAVQALQEQLQIAERGKKTGVLQVTLDGPDPALTAATLDALARAYVRQNVERHSAEAARTLEFLESQLPKLRDAQRQADAALEAYRARRGAVDVSMQAQAVVARTAEIERAVTELELEYATLREKFTDSHPLVAANRSKQARLAQERTVVAGQLRALPTTELESAQLVRDAKVAGELYVMLMNRAQELKVVKAGTLGNVRVLDAAVVPYQPVRPRRALVVLLAAVAGLGLGVVAALARRALAVGVEDPQVLERATGVGVHASVPRSEAQERAGRRARQERVAIPILAATSPGDLAVESLRSLRTSLLFSLIDSPSGVVAIGGPSPGVGKSFVTANLGHLLAEGGKRVVVVDGDLRRGHLHAYFDRTRERGLSDVILGRLPLAETVRAPAGGVAFLPTGTVPPNPAELLGSDRFGKVLEELSAQFDLVLIDTPPILAVTDAALVARHAGVNLMVLRAGTHPLREVQAALRVYERNGVRIDGLVLNAVRLDRGFGRSGAMHYQYSYR